MVTIHIRVSTDIEYPWTLTADADIVLVVEDDRGPQFIPLRAGQPCYARGATREQSFERPRQELKGGA